MRSDAGDYQSQSYQFYQKNVFPTNKYVPSSQSPGSFGAVPSSNVPSSGFGSVVKPTQIYSPKVSASSSQDMSKYSMSTVSTSPAKPFSSTQQPISGDWNKTAGISNLQYKNNSIQGKVQL